jgi:hypothetical protein
MASAAYDAFERALTDVDNLMWFHESEGGDAPGRRAAYFEALNKSAIVLLCAAWESYVEFVISEAAQANIDAAAGPDQMLKSLRKLTGSLVRSSSDERLWQQVAGDGWRDLSKAAVAAKVGALNTPKPVQVKELFSTVLGVEDIGSNWTWAKNPLGRPAETLKDFVTLRGSIAHGERRPRAVTKADVTKYRRAIERLVNCVEAALVAAELMPEDDEE